MSTVTPNATQLSCDDDGDRDREREAEFMRSNNFTTVAPTQPLLQPNQGTRYKQKGTRYTQLDQANDDEGSFASYLPISDKTSVISQL